MHDTYQFTFPFEAYSKDSFHFSVLIYMKTGGCLAKTHVSAPQPPSVSRTVYETVDVTYFHV